MLTSATQNVCLCCCAHNLSHKTKLESEGPACEILKGFLVLKEARLTLCFIFKLASGRNSGARLRSTDGKNLNAQPLSLYNYINILEEPRLHYEHVQCAARSTSFMYLWTVCSALINLE